MNVFNLEERFKKDWGIDYKLIFFNRKQFKLPLTDGFRTFLPLRVVRVVFVKLRTSHYLATEAFAPDAS